MNFIKNIPNRISMVIILAGLFILCMISPLKATAYFIDSQNGNDKFNGISEKNAWSSIEQVNKYIFQPGDKILFKAGTHYSGNLSPKGVGTEKEVIRIGTYGGQEKAYIHANGKHLSALLLENTEYWEIENLEITNRGIEREGGRTGVSIVCRNMGDCHHIYLKNLTIHDVNGSLIKNDGGGSAIYWKNEGDEIPTRFIDLKIENCHLYKCERNGIIGSGYYNRKHWYPSIGIVIRNNLLEEIPGDGIVPIGCDGAVIEYNTMRKCPDILPHSEAAAGIWPWSCDNTIIQYNHVSGHNAKWDGQGFDADWNCQNTLFQYNYSSNNAGGFFLVCNNGNNLGSSINIGTTGTVIRYNVSVNDGIRNYPTERSGYFSPVFHISGPVKNTRVYNNIIYITPKKHAEIDRTLLKMDNWGGPWPDSTFFANNIFITTDSSCFNFGKSTANYFSNNLYNGFFFNMPDDPKAVYSLPCWLAPKDVNEDYSSLQGFMIKNDSPCLDKGMKITNELIKDFFGNMVDNSPSIGIHEYISE